jgi:thioesterase domain-containing protein
MQLTLSYVIRRIRHHWAWQIRKRWQRHFNPPDPVNATDWNPEKRVRVACNQAYTSYDPQFYEGTIVFIRAENASRPNAYQFWQAFVGGMQLLTAPGTHKGILGPENTKELAKTIDEVLENIGR